MGSFTLRHQVLTDFPPKELRNVVDQSKKDIKEGEEITFDYETTEEILAEPFSCQCHGRLIEGWNAIKIHQRRKSFMMG